VSSREDRVPARALEHGSRERGHLARWVYIVRTTPTGSIADLQPYIDEHLAYYEELTDAGKVYRAGPVFSEDGEWWEGEGLIVLCVDSVEEAREIAAADPMHRNGGRDWTITPWLVNHALGGSF
jgi:uncharacterized protein YciI